MADLSELEIYGAGMASSLGIESVSSCSAARAGLVRLSPLPYMVEDKENFEMIPVIGNAIPGLAMGFTELGRLVQIATFAFKDCLAKFPTNNFTLSRCAILVNLASDACERMLEARKPGSSKSESQEISKVKYADLMAWYSEKFIQNLLRNCQIDGTPKISKVVFEDQLGLVKTLKLAKEYLASGTVEYCIIGGVDTLLEHNKLEVLDALKQLKSPINQVGLIPGEGAAFICVGRSGSLAEEAHADRLVIGNEALVDEVNVGNTNSGGRNLSVAVLETIKKSNCRSAEFWVDLNGTVERAAIWGSALVDIHNKVNITKQMAAAESFGDVGAASAYIAVLMAMHTFSRNYNTGDASILVLIADTGGFASCSVRRGAYNVRKSY